MIPVLQPQAIEGVSSVARYRDEFDEATQEMEKHLCLNKIVFYEIMDQSHDK